jgi:hypothetical protein
VGVGMAGAAGRDRDQRCADESVRACPGHPAFPLWNVVRCSLWPSLRLCVREVNPIRVSATDSARRESGCTDRQAPIWIFCRDRNATIDA